MLSSFIIEAGLRIVLFTHAGRWAGVGTRVHGFPFLNSVRRRLDVPMEGSHLVLQACEEKSPSSSSLRTILTLVILWVFTQN